MDREAEVAAPADLVDPVACRKAIPSGLRAQAVAIAAVTATDEAAEVRPDGTPEAAEEGEEEPSPSGSRTSSNAKRACNALAAS